MAFPSSCHRPQIRLMEQVDASGEGPEHATVMATFEESVHGRNTEQILTSPYFGLTTTRAPEVVAELNRLARATHEGDATAAAEFLRRLASRGRP